MGDHPKIIQLLVPRVPQGEGEFVRSPFALPLAGGGKALPGRLRRRVLVNTLTGESMELKLNEIFAKAKGIYPQWSISF